MLRHSCDNRSPRPPFLHSRCREPYSLDLRERVNIRPGRAIKHFTAYDPVAKWTLATSRPQLPPAAAQQASRQRALQGERYPSRRGIRVYVGLRRTPSSCRPSGPPSTVASNAPQSSWRYEFYACFDLPARIDKLHPSWTPSPPDTITTDPWRSHPREYRNDKARRPSRLISAGPGHCAWIIPCGARKSSARSCANTAAPHPTRRHRAGRWDCDDAIARLDRTIAKLVLKDETARRLMSIPGFGPITASAMAATVQDTSSFAGPREFAAFLGLTPKQNSSGGKLKLGRISKMGNRNLRKLLVVGAHAVLFHREPHTDPLRMWAKKLIEKI